MMEGGSGVITKPSWGGIADRFRPRIGYAAFCQAVPECGRSAVAGNLRAGLGKVADVIDIWSAPVGRAPACDAILAMDCVGQIPEPYFIYLCPEQGNMLRVDPSVYERALGLEADSIPARHNLIITIIRRHFPIRMAAAIGPCLITGCDAAHHVPPAMARPEQIPGLGVNAI